VCLQVKKKFNFFAVNINLEKNAVQRTLLSYFEFGTGVYDDLFRCIKLINRFSGKVLILYSCWEGNILSVVVSIQVKTKLYIVFLGTLL